MAPNDNSSKPMTRYERKLKQNADNKRKAIENESEERRVYI